MMFSHLSPLQKYTTVKVVHAIITHDVNVFVIATPLKPRNLETQFLRSVASLSLLLRCVVRRSRLSVGVINAYLYFTEKLVALLSVRMCLL